MEFDRAGTNYFKVGRLSSLIFYAAANTATY
jgi:hypothetical protein